MQDRWKKLTIIVCYQKHKPNIDAKLLKALEAWFSTCFVQDDIQTFELVKTLNI